MARTPDSQTTSRHNWVSCDGRVRRACLSPATSGVNQQTFANCLTKFGCQPSRRVIIRSYSHEQDGESMKGVACSVQSSAFCLAWPLPMLVTIRFSKHQLPWSLPESALEKGRNCSAAAFFQAICAPQPLARRSCVYARSESCEPICSDRASLCAATELQVKRAKARQTQTDTDLFACASMSRPPQSATPENAVRRTRRVVPTAQAAAATETTAGRPLSRRVLLQLDRASPTRSLHLLSQISAL